MGQLKQKAIAEGYFDRPDHDCHASPDDGCAGCEDEELLRRQIVEPIAYVHKEISKAFNFDYLI